MGPRQRCQDTLLWQPPVARRGTPPSDGGHQPRDGLCPLDTLLCVGLTRGPQLTPLFTKTRNKNLFLAYETPILIKVIRAPTFKISILNDFLFRVPGYTEI